MAKLTHQQKLDALSYRFYQGGIWEPQAGDYYTTSRADLELYQVVSVEDGIVRTRFTEGSESIAEWPESEFLTGGFGPKRVFVPPWVISAPAHPAQFTPGIAAFLAIDAERLRQTASEGWTPAHDDEHRDGSMAVAAACYAMFASVSDAAREATDMPSGLTVSRTPIKGWSAWFNIWPWSRAWWKPTTRKRDLEKAGALIAAEWERLDRLENATPSSNGGDRG